jgi:tetratricopeptide (TPR) repeat protein
MKRIEFETKLRQLKSASVARARMLVQDLEPSAARVDSVLREDFRKTLELLGFARPTFSAVNLLPGETWLLLYEAPRGGWAVRARAFYDAAEPALDDRLAIEVRRAHRGLLSSVARACRQLGRSSPPFLDLDVPFGTFELEGSSLGLSVAIAALSATLGRAPATHVAGSAQVDDDGRLRPVEHLAVKLEALRRSWPEVTHVVVATRQKLPEGYACPVELAHCESLTDAIRVFGLTLDGLPPARLDDFRDRVARFRTDNSRPHGAEEWARLSAVAWETAAALAVEDPEKSAEAGLWAALFAVHSGDPAAADALLRGVPPETAATYPELHARQLITSASSQIDTEHIDEAIALSEHAVKLCGPLSSTDRRGLLGQALGTHGRALMHAGRLDEAEAFLRRALAHHRNGVPREVPRSQCYLATCLRLAGRAEEALVVVNDALAAAEAFAGRWNDVVTTGLYLHLERGRVYAALAMWQEASADFLLVRDGQLEDVAYPRLGALRGLAGALRALEHIDAADDALRACLGVARGGSAPILRKVAAIAAGEALLDARPTQIVRSEIEDAWASIFGADMTSAHIAAVVRAWVY